MKQELICIVCPKGCHLTAEQTAEGWQITGFGCPRGQQYGIAEMTNPTRVVTSTVRITGGVHPRLPVKTDGPLPRSLVREAVRMLWKFRPRSAAATSFCPISAEPASILLPAAICKNPTSGEECVLPVLVVLTGFSLKIC